MRDGNDETTGRDAAGSDGAETANDEQPTREKCPGMVGRQAWEFFHPPHARWTAPGEQRARSTAARLSQGLERSRGKQVVVGVAALVLVIVMCVGTWAVLRPDGEPAAGESGQSETSEPKQALPGGSSGAQEEASGQAEPAGEASQPEPSGREADEAALKEINAGDGLVTARDEDADDPLVTGARFLRSLRSTDTTSDSVEDWYEARCKRA